MIRFRKTLTAGLIAAMGVLNPVSAQTGAAFLDLGQGGRALGFGGALSAHATGAEAVYYNPAGLASARGRSIQAGLQSLSLDRTHATLAGSMNLRGGLAFGLAWTYASAGEIDARTGSGDVVAGGIDDAEQAISFALGTKVHERLMVGAGFKILNHEIDVSGSGVSSASGRGMDLGALYDISPSWRVAIGARNLLGKLSWTVRSAAEQSSSSEDDLPATPYLGLGGTWRRVVLGMEAQLYDMSGVSQPRIHLGGEIELSPMLTLRAGVHRVGDADGFGLPSMGLSVRPMHSDDLQFHYAWVADDVGAGGRSVLSVGGLF